MSLLPHNLREPAPAPRPSRPPGGGCDILRTPHAHWCGWCLSGRLFTREQCRTLPEPPQCSWCGSIDWRTEAEIVGRFPGLP